MGANDSPRVRRFIEDVDHVVARDLDDRAAAEAVASLLEGLLSSRDWLDEGFLRPLPNRPYSQYPLHVCENGAWSMLCLTWPAGSSTPIHDHGTWGVVGVYVGEERETIYELFDGNLRVGGVRTWGPGEVATILPPDDLHAVANTGSTVAVSIHVYGADIGRHERRAWDDSGAVSIFVSGYDDRAK